MKVDADVETAPSGRKLRSVSEWKASGLEVSTDSDRSARILDLAIEMMVGVYGDPYRTAFAAAEEDEDFALPVCLLLWLKLLGSSGNLDDKDVVELVKRMERAASSREHTDREKGIVAAVLEISRGRIEAAIDLVEQVAVLSPHDAMLAKLQNDLVYFTGVSKRMRDYNARALSAMDDKTPLIGYVYGMYAFTCEESDDFAKALVYADKALEVNERDVWAIHAKAHVYETTGRAQEGYDFLMARKPQWEDSNLACHCYWHLGLCHLELGKKDEALSLFDDNLSKFIGPGGVFALVDSTQLLQRMELESIDVGRRWQKVVNPWYELRSHHRVAFNDLHIVVAIAAGQSGDMRDGVEASMQSFLADKAVAKTTSHMTLSLLGEDVMGAVFAFRDGRYQECVRLIMKHRYDIYRFGGSGAQRDLLMLLALHSCIRSADRFHLDLAKQLLHERMQIMEGSTSCPRILAEITKSG